eukprot:7193485-Alexandrium_andersonii.AAC.1
MSASLVGSEMCIRDRPWAFSDTREVLSPTMPDSRLECRVEEEGQAQPVSYTHLTLPTICSV